MRGLIIGSSSAHSSIVAAGRAMDADVVEAPADERGRMTGAALRPTIDALVRRGPRARCSPSSPRRGTTNAGVIDDLAGVADVCRASTASGCTSTGPTAAPALAAPSVRHRYDGIERADSFIVDPHKWLFAPFDCCALLYRDPDIARAAHTQHAEYLDVLHADDHADEPWNPSDFAHHLSRRARGLPFWFSLATYGTDAYTDGGRDHARRSPTRAPR